MFEILWGEDELAKILLREQDREDREYEFEYKHQRKTSREREWDRESLERRRRTSPRVTTAHNAAYWIIDTCTIEPETELWAEAVMDCSRRIWLNRMRKRGIVVGPHPLFPNAWRLSEQRVAPYEGTLP